MNIVCTIHSLDGGGAERVMAGLASRLAGRGHRVTLITLGDGTSERHQVADTVARRWLGQMRPRRGLIDGWRSMRRRAATLRQAIADETPDVVLSFCDRMNILTLMAARPLRVPVVISERSDPSQQKLGVLWEHLRRHTYRHATAIVALTETAAEHLRRRFGQAVVVIGSAVDAPPMRSDRRAAIAQKRIVAAGRLEREKGFDRLIDAFAPVAAKHPQWRLRILGEGSHRTALEAQIQQLGLSDRVSLPGWVQPVWSELAAATFFALPSRYEGLPSALLEAMALGVPSLAVDCPSGPRAVINDPACGLLVRDCTEALTAGMLRWIEDAAERERVGQAGMQVVERFGWDAMVDRYEQLLARAAGQGPVDGAATARR